GGAGGGLTRTGEIFGSPLYMSPEQAQGLPVGPATDIYSFGCSIFEALTGEVPLKGGNALETMLMHQSKAAPRLGEIRPDLEFSPELEKFVARLLAKKPADRYQSFAEIASQLLLLERPQTGMRTAALPQTRMEKEKDDYSGDYTDPPRPVLTTKPWFWPTVIAGTIVMLGGIGFITYQAVKPREVARPAYSLPQPTTAESGSPPKQIDVVQSFSHEEVIDGRKVKVFNFPENSDLGLLSYDLAQQELEQKNTEWKRTHSEGEHNPFSTGIRARGRQIIDPAYPLVFTPDEQTCNTPAVFKLFKADDLYKLDLTGNEYVNSDFLPFIKHLKGLRELFLDDTTVDDKGLKVIDGLSNLEFLRIDHTKISGTALAQSKVLSRVSRLSFSDGQDASSVIEAIKNNKNITELRLDKCVLTKHDLELLSAMPALVKLDVNDAGIGDDGLKILAKSKTLARLAIRDEKVTSASMSTLINMHLQKLTLLAQNWSAEDQEKLKAALSKPPRHCHLEFKSFGI
ncbi:MAG: hypothetical protein JSS86_11130, partial [Cyanobacteria bacterium SZAS LIN-2]|nr:hypothetical protein [Cyanobacteria bacterium SZAS LIN-2]